MRRTGFTLFVVAAIAQVVLSGCSRPQWEITVENKSEVPCSFDIVHGGAGSVKVNDVAKGKVLSLIVGDHKTVIQSVKVVRGKEEETLTPKVELPPGKRYAIVVAADGKAAGTVLDR